jgi:hypothetical protein
MEKLTPARTSLIVMISAFAATIASIASLNYWIDPVGIYDNGQRANAAAQQLAAGRDLIAANIADRELQLAYAKTVARAPQILVMGSSRVMGIGNAVAPGRTLYNSGLSTATLPDILAVGEIFLSAGKLAPVVVIGVDPWLFDRTPRNGRWRTLTPQYKAMLARMGAEDEALPAAADYNLLNLISAAYTVESARVIFVHWRSILSSAGTPAVEFANDKTKVAVKRFDGSLTYGEDMRRRGSVEIRSAALAQAHKEMTAIMAGGWLDQGKIDLFQRFVRLLRSQGTSVILLMTPYHPDNYAYVREHDAKGSFAQTEAVVKKIGLATGAMVEGSYDPAVAKCAEAEFWDGMHARGRCLDQILRPALEPIAAGKGA